MKLTLVHLFPRHMNIYGDQGNIIALTRRCLWRGIEIDYRAVNTVEDFDLVSTGDLFFFGGGQDKDQMLVWEAISHDQQRMTQLIHERVDADAVFLLICGGYQLFGSYFIDARGQRIPGLGILDITTMAPGPEVRRRCIGNIEIATHLPIRPQTLVGFENHGGQTELGTGMRALGRVIKGYGDNVRDGIEGCIWRQIYGCYMHGALLPKNPHFTDYLITQALKAKYGEVPPLVQLDDRLEHDAHRYVIDRIM